MLSICKPYMSTYMYTIYTYTIYIHCIYTYMYAFIIVNGFWWGKWLYLCMLFNVLNCANSTPPPRPSTIYKSCGRHSHWRAEAVPILGLRKLPSKDISRERTQVGIKFLLRTYVYNSGFMKYSNITCPSNLEYLFELKM